MIPAEERVDLHIHPGLKELLAAEADKHGLTLNEAATQILCRGLRRNPKDFPIPRKSPGRKRKQP